MKLRLSMIFAALALSGAVNANEVVLTQAKGGSGQVAVDFANSGQATAFEFEIVMPKGVRNVDTSNCLSELASTHTGVCRFNPKTGRVVVMVMSNDNRLLPDGIVALGRITADGAGGAPASVEKLLVSDQTGRALPATASQQSSSERREKPVRSETFSDR